MRIRKLICIMTVMAGLCLLILPISFAKDSIIPITSPLTEPVPSIVSGSDYDTVTLYYVVQWNASYQSNENLRYELYEMIAKIPHGSTAVLNIKRQQTALFFSGNRLPPYTVNHYNIKDGVLKSSETNMNGASYGSVNGYSSSYGFVYGYFPENNAYSDICAGGYAIVPEGISIVGGESVYNSSPFVTWATGIPDQVSYKSPLSEPVADQYNSYAVLDDHLIWVSYRVNAMYSANNQIESSSQVFSSIGSYSESGTGNYAGQQNGYTEDVSLPDGEFIGASQSGSGGTTLYSGGYSGFDFGNIDFSGVNSGNVHFNSNGSVTYNDVEYRPISFSQLDILSYFRLYCIPTASDNFVFWLAPDHSFTNDILINMDFFFSEFDLDGNYIRSSFNQVTSTELGLFDSYSPEDPVSSVRFYGIDFYNLNNLPLNLSSVLWQYDFEFSAWRDSMLNMLTSIYNALTSDSNVPEAPTTANWGQEVHNMEPSSQISNDEVISIYENVGEINSSLSDSSDSLYSLVDMFSIGKLIGLVAFALSIGTAILILGKKKSE